jgi:hypothetical protein
MRVGVEGRLEGEVVMSLQIRSLAAALILVLLAGGTAQALPLSGPALSAGGEGGFLEAAWSWVVSLFPSSGVQGKFSKGFIGSEAGGMMDPNGSTIEAAKCGGTSEEGGMMDPNGLR